MVKAGGALPCVTDRERPGKDGHVFLELWTTHCYCCYYTDSLIPTQLRLLSYTGEAKKSSGKARRPGQEQE